MKLYRTVSGIVVEREEDLRLVENVEWDEIVACEDPGPLLARVLKHAGDRSDEETMSEAVEAAVDPRAHARGLVAPSTRTPPARFLSDVVVDLGLAGPDEVESAVESARTVGAS